MGEMGQLCVPVAVVVSAGGKPADGPGCCTSDYYCSDEVSAERSAGSGTESVSQMSALPQESCRTCRKMCGMGEKCPWEKRDDLQKTLFVTKICCLLSCQKTIL